MTENNQPDRLTDEPILDLTEAVEGTQESVDNGSGEVDPLATTLEFENDFDDGFDSDQDDDDFVDSLGMEIGDEDDEEQEEFSTPEEQTDVSGALDVSPEQLDAALERVIQKMFYDRIDRILVNVIEKRVKREIERIKGMLLDEAGDDA